MVQLKQKSGQAILEYLLLVIMLSITIALLIRNINFTIYGLWTGMARQVAAPCANCQTPDAPGL